MHPFSADNDRARYAYLAIAVAAVMLAYLLGLGLNHLSVVPPWWLDTPAVLGFYGILWKLYDGFIWRMPIGRSNVAGIVNLRGKWNGVVDSDFNGGSPVQATMEIDQTATRIRVSLVTDTSRSESAMAAVRSSGAFAGLHYNYFNEPRPLAAQTMHPHRGDCAPSA
jgi:hypothetical protein